MIKIVIAAFGAVLAGSSSVQAYSPPSALLTTIEPAATDGCCGSDEDNVSPIFGYSLDLWDQGPTMGNVYCPNQDDACLLKAAGTVLGLIDLQKKLELSILFRQIWYAESVAYVARANHFSDEPLDSLSRIAQPMVANN